MKPISSLLIVLMLLASHALAESGTLTISPAESDNRGPIMNVNTALQFTLESSIPAKTATLNLTRAGRSVGGEIPLKLDGKVWRGTAKLEFPGAHIITARMFEDQRVWSAALDSTALEPDAPSVQSKTSQQNLEFVVTEGKAGSDTNGLWGILALVVLALIVYFATRNAKKPIKL